MEVMVGNVRDLWELNNEGARHRSRESRAVSCVGPRLPRPSAPENPVQPECPTKQVMTQEGTVVAGGLQKTVPEVEADMQVACWGWKERTCGQPRLAGLHSSHRSADQTDRLTCDSTVVFGPV